MALRPPPGWFDALPSDRLLAEFSLWSADLVRMADDIDRVDPFVDLYHIDVADGHFSPAFLMFPDLVAAVRRLTAKPLHVHLMATDDILIDQIDQFADAGVDLITLHVEIADVHTAIDHVEARGLIPGLVLQLETPVAAAAPYLDRVRLLTLLGTAIGVKGQGLAPQALDRLREASGLIAARSSADRLILAADGAIRQHTVPDLRKAGAETIVMGSLAFGAPDLAATIAWVHAQERAVVDA